MFIPCGRLSWLPVSFSLHVKYTLLYRIALGMQKLECWVYQVAKNVYDILAVSTQYRRHACDRQTDRQTSCDCAAKTSLKKFETRIKGIHALAPGSATSIRSRP